MKLYTEKDLIDLVQSLKNYTYESRNILGHDEREAEEFVNIFLKDRTSIELPTDEEIEELYYKELEKRREAAKNFTGQIAGRHSDMFGHNEIHHMVRGYLECIKWIKNKII